MTKSKLDSTLDTLFEKLDQRAIKILDDLDKLEQGTDDVTDPDFNADFVSYSERARMFAEVSKYAQSRQAMKPPPPVPATTRQRAKFHDLKSRFHGNAPESGAGQAKPRARR